MLFGFLRCLFLAHEPDRLRVKKASQQVYFGYCAHCGARIRRVRRNEWKRTRRWPEAAAD